MENSTVRALEGRSGEDAVGWAELEELESLTAAFESTPMRAQEKTLKRDSLKGETDSEHTDMQTAETCHSNRKVAVARPSGVHRVNPRVGSMMTPEEMAAFEKELQELEVLLFGNTAATTGVSAQDTFKNEFEALTEDNARKTSAKMSARQKTQQVPPQIAATAAAGTKSQRNTNLESNDMQLAATMKQAETAESQVLMHETEAEEMAPKTC